MRIILFRNKTAVITHDGSEAVSIGGYRDDVSEGVLIVGDRGIPVKAGDAEPRVSPVLHTSGAFVTPGGTRYAINNLYSIDGRVLCAWDGEQMAIEARMAAEKALELLEKIEGDVRELKSAERYDDLGVF